MNIWEIVGRYYLDVLLGLISGAIVMMWNQLKEQRKQNKAQNEGVQALLRNSIIGVYHRSIERDCLPIYEKDNVNKLYSCYKALNGNGTVDALVKELMTLPVVEKEVIKKGGC